MVLAWNSEKKPSIMAVAKVPSRGPATEPPIRAASALAWASAAAWTVVATVVSAVWAAGASSGRTVSIIEARARRPCDGLDMGSSFGTQQEHPVCAYRVHRSQPRRRSGQQERHFASCAHDGRRKGPPEALPA